MPVYIIGTLDTKGAEVAHVRDLLQSLGVATRIVDAGCLGEPTLAADVSRDAVFEAAGKTLAEVRDRGDRGHAVTLAAVGVARLIASAYEQGDVTGLLGLGGSAGTSCSPGSPQIDGQYARLGSDSTLRWQQRYPDAQRRRRHCRLEPHQPDRPGKRGPRHGGDGDKSQSTSGGSQNQ